jgi:hypothetical protein
MYAYSSDAMSYPPVSLMFMHRVAIGQPHLLLCQKLVHCLEFLEKISSGRMYYCFTFCLKRKIYVVYNECYGHVL